VVAVPEVAARRHWTRPGVAVGVAIVSVLALFAVSGGDDPASGAPEEATTTGVPTVASTIGSTSTAPRVVIRQQEDRRVDGEAAVTSTTEPPVATAPPQDPTSPAVVARPVPVEPPPPPPDAPPPPWATSRYATAGGHLSTDVGCARDVSASGLDAFFAERVGPVLGWDYQHVYQLGDGRNLWLFQDTFIDQSGTASTLDRASFVHNAALVQDGACFRLLHAGTAERPQPFESGDGTATLTRWFWPMGGELHDGVLVVFWAEMAKDPVDPIAPDGLGWHPVRTHVATYDPATLARLDFRPAPDPGVTPIYGYSVASDSTHTYLFGNSFEQNLARHGGFWNGPHDGTKMFLARVPRGRLFDQPEYWSSAGWRADPRGSEPFLARHWAEFPMQPRWLDGQWVAATAVDGYWGDQLTIDVANDPWGPWTTVDAGLLLPRGSDPLMNTYHAHLMPSRGRGGELVVTVSNNARDMLRDAWPVPARYRPVVFPTDWHTAPPPPSVATSTTTTIPVPTTTTSTTTPVSTTTSTSTTVPATSTTVPATTNATTSPDTSTKPGTPATTTTIAGPSTTGGGEL
jgi:hypothetical protein